MKVFDLPIHRSSAWIFNCYLIGAEDEPLVAIDAGLPIVTQRVLASVRDDLSREPGDVVAIAATHAHPDHVGGVADLHTATGATVHLPARCAAYLDGETPRAFPVVESGLRFLPVFGEQPFEARGLLQFLSASRRVGYPPELRVDFTTHAFVGPGDTIPGLDEWEIIHAPGHSDDSTCLYHADSATLISGDAVVTQDGHAWFTPEYVDLDVAKQTEERLRSLDVRHLLPGHGRPIVSTDVWADARSSTDRPTGRSFLARCARRVARWP